MKSKIILVFIISILIPVKEIPAQNNFHFELSGGLVLQGPGEGIFNAGKDAWTVGLNASYSIFRDIRINLQAGYYNFPNYKNQKIQGIVNPIPLMKQSDYAPRTNFSTLEKTSAKVYQLSSGITFISNFNSEFYPYVSVYSGLYFFKYLTYSYPIYGLDGTDFYFPPKLESISLTKGFASLGIGLLIPVANMINLNLQGIYSVTFDDNKSVQNFIPVLIGIEFSL